MSGFGLEFYPFKVNCSVAVSLRPLSWPQSQIGWYNDRVQEVFKLPHHDDTLGVVVISSPDMFELLFRPYLLKHHTQQQHDPGEASDPLDRCMKLQFDQMKALCASHDVYSLQDFELLPTRRPKILVQTAGHVAGAAYYYQLSDVENPPWEGKKKIYGVSIHPLYGGWFGGLRCPALSHIRWSLSVDLHLQESLCWCTGAVTSTVSLGARSDHLLMHSLTVTPLLLIRALDCSLTGFIEQSINWCSLFTHTITHCCCVVLQVWILSLITQNSSWFIHSLICHCHSL